ncbi:MAG: trigger factor, partial [Clostridia bacterium]|nr:trigger factor [Clostridia bacterium]
STIEQSSTTEEVTDRTDVKDGDIVNIDYEGKKDGVAFDGGTAQGFDLTIGSHSFIDGFEDGLIGKKVGETATLDLKFPDNYTNNPDLSGQPVVFTVKINSIKEKKVPTLDDAFVKTVSTESKTVAEYKKEVETKLLSSKEDTAEREMADKIWQMAYDNATVSEELPDDLIKQKVELMNTNVKLYADAYGMEVSDYITNFMGMTEDQFKEMTNTYAIDAAKQSLVLAAIVKAEKLDLTAEEIADAITEYTKLYGYESEEKFKETNDMEEFEEYVLKSKVQKFLQENAVIKDE